MNLLTVLFVALAGGLGAAARFALDGFIKERVPDGIPWGTIAINLSGSFLLGVVAGLAAGTLSPAIAHILGAGFLGGYTTFSAASFETVQLLRKGEWRAAAFNAFGVLAASVLLAMLGLWLGLTYAP